MKNQGGWTSEYRRKKFERRYNRPKRVIEPNTFIREPLFTKSIAVMLDIEGTCDNIDDEKARLFINCLDLIRRKFGASFGTINMSTHCNNSRKMKEVLTILSRNLSKDIRIDMGFFYGGTYDFNSDTETMRHPDFNRDKVSTFVSGCVNLLGVNNAWFALIDDSIQEGTYKKFNREHPILIAKPSCIPSELTKNSFVRIASVKRGFDGVLEILNTYLENIRDMTVEEIKEAQKNMIMHLSSTELMNVVLIERDYDFLKRYFEGGYADEDDYEDVSYMLQSTVRNHRVTKEELLSINEILGLIAGHFKDAGQEATAQKIIALKSKLENGK